MAKHKKKSLAKHLRKKRKQKQSKEKGEEMDRDFNLTADVKKRQDELFDWHGNTQLYRNVSNADISINFVCLSSKNNVRNMGFSLTFRNESYNHFPNGFQYAFKDNKIFFRPSEEGLGLRAKKNSSTPNHYARFKAFNEEEEKKFKEFIGDYTLKYNEYIDLYYIEK